nr:immunoglobulin light chain junction region [Macaca mulatta]
DYSCLIWHDNAWVF